MLPKHALKMYYHPLIVVVTKIAHAPHHPNDTIRKISLLQVSIASMNRLELLLGGLFHNEPQYLGTQVLSSREINRVSRYVQAHSGVALTPLAGPCEVVFNYWTEGRVPVPVSGLPFGEAWRGGREKGLLDRSRLEVSANIRFTVFCRTSLPATRKRNLPPESNFRYFNTDCF